MEDLRSDCDAEIFPPHPGPLPREREMRSRLSWMLESFHFCLGDEDDTDAEGGGEDGDGEEVAEGFTPCGEETAGGHGDDGDEEAEGAEVGSGGGDGEVWEAEAVEEIDEAEAEEGDMAEACEAPAVGGVAAHPVFAMEEETDDGAGDDAGHHGPPAGADGECDDLLHIN
jgi:hypothetical protein